MVISIFWGARGTLQDLEEVRVFSKACLGVLSTAMREAPREICGGCHNLESFSDRPTSDPAPSQTVCL